MQNNNDFYNQNGTQQNNYNQDINYNYNGYSNNPYGNNSYYSNQQFNQNNIYSNPSQSYTPNNYYEYENEDESYVLRDNESIRKNMIISLIATGFSLVFFLIKEILFFNIINIYFNRQNMMILLMVSLFLSAVSSVLAIWMEKQNNNLEKKYKITILSNLYISLVLLIENIYMLLMFYFAK